MGLDSSAYGNYPTPFIGIFQILLKKPSYSSSNIFQIPFLRPPSQTINLRSESCLRYRCTWRREMPIFSDICVAFFGLYTILPAPRHPYGTICVSVRLCQLPSEDAVHLHTVAMFYVFIVKMQLCLFAPRAILSYSVPSYFFFLFSKAFFCSLANLRSTFFTSSAGGRFSGTIPRCTSISRTAALLAICSWLIRLSP